MVGGGFQNQISSHRVESKWIEWVKDGSASYSMHIDHAIAAPVDPRKKNFAWIFESTAIIPDVIAYLIKNISRLEMDFDLIFTHDKRLLPLSEKIRWCVPQCKPWVERPAMYQKSKLVSMIASTKIMCSGHAYRQDIANRYKNKLDLFGRGHVELADKLNGLAEYCFSFSMENDNYSSNFTEKIADCFATATIPIFWGAPDIGDFFNTNGLILLEENFDIEMLSFDFYMSKIEAIKENHERVLNFPNPEDFIYSNYLFRI
jgi:hypothetical protein